MITLKANLLTPVNLYKITTVLHQVYGYSAILQNIFNDAEDFSDGDEWMEDDLMLASSAAASDHDGLRSPPPYSLQTTLSDFGNTAMSRIYDSTQIQTRKSCTGRSPVRSIGLRA